MLVHHGNAQQFCGELDTLKYARMQGALQQVVTNVQPQSGKSPLTHVSQPLPAIVGHLSYLREDL